MLTRAKGEFDRADIVPGMAFFSATGPRGTFCTDCRWRRDIKSSRKIRCALFKLMRGYDGEAFDHVVASCKYMNIPRWP
jgi:hypothetical protein